MSRLHELYEQQGQSPWIDNLKRSYLLSGELAELRDSGIRGVTSNPTIFEKAIAGGTDYDEQFGSLVATHAVEDAYWELVVQDIGGACKVMAPTYNQSGGNDGFVSIEVSPALALDEAATTISARELDERIAAANLMVKIPATKAGLGSIRQMISEGRNINVTLIFSLTRYAEVIESHISGLEQLAATGVTDLSHVNSVASFFISRVDTEVDRRLNDIGTDEARSLRGKLAVAQAHLAYQLYQTKFSGARWQALADAGAKPQRPLWASTSIKNPDYQELLYVDSLIGPNTVNTMPDPTVKAFMERGTVARTVDADFEAAQKVMDQVGNAGVDLADVAVTLENEGVASFMKSYDELLQVLADKYESLREASQ